MIREKEVITHQNHWARVAQELEAEHLKLESYDTTLLGLLGDVTDKKIVDYGCGPGILASALQRGRADIRAYDLSEEMRALCGEKIGDDRVYASVDAIPKDYFDDIICNLVLCIVEDDVVPEIAQNLRNAVNDKGRVYIGFCNPRIFQVPESQLDLRHPTGQSYTENHKYWKTKREGGYRIVEEHRPLEWYEETFTNSGLVVLQKHFTPEYKLQGNKIQDFVIFELERR